MDIHPTAIIGKNVIIKKGVKIGPYCFIDGNITIEENCILLSHVYLTGNVKIGKNNIIFPFTSIGASPQDLKYKGEETWVYIGDNNTIREYVTINKGTQLGGGKTVVGNNNLIMAYVHIAHDCQIGNNIVLTNGVNLAGHINIEDFAIVGGMTGVHHFVTIGQYSFIGGMSRINKDVPPFMLVEGNPARIRGANLVGLKRNGIPEKDISAIKKAARILYKEENLLSEAIEKIKRDKSICENSYIQKLIQFLINTSKGKYGRALEASRASDPDLCR